MFWMVISRMLKCCVRFVKPVIQKIAPFWLLKIPINPQGLVALSINNPYLRRLRLCFLFTALLIGQSSASSEVSATDQEIEPVSIEEVQIETDEDIREEKINAIISLHPDSDTNAVWNHIETQLPSVEKEEEFEHALTGFSVLLTEEEADQIEELTAVKTVEEAKQYTASLKESVPFIGAEVVRNRLDENGVRLSGKGIKVGVIDTGIDYDHPDLRRNFKGGKDLVDQDDDPMETKKDGEAATFHGTHVSGIIAANGAVRGVAPEADLYVYRALGPGGHGSTNTILQAIEQAIEDEVDVLNLSLGSPVNGPDWPTSEALDRAAEAGIITVSSNGNSGPGMWSVGSPGTSEKTISVGASVPPLRQPQIHVNAEETMEIQPVQGTMPWRFHRPLMLADGGLGLESDLENIRGKAVLINRGGISIEEKLEMANKAGAAAVIIANNTAGAFPAGVEDPVKIPAVTVTKEDGAALEDMLEEKETVPLYTDYIEETDHMAGFSSRGPVAQSFAIKPDVVAPGVDIDSTVPEGYLALNGTSMAAPHVAGAAALIKQARPDWGPQQVKAALMNTAIPLDDDDAGLYPPYVQGAGRVEIPAALEATTLATPGSLSFGTIDEPDTHRIERNMTIENHDSRKRSYSFEAPTLLGTGLTWHLPTPLILEPGETEEVTIGLEIQPDVIDMDHIDGHVTLVGGREDIDIPFLLFKNEPDYPRITTFQLHELEDSYAYELYAPGGAEHVTILLYQPDTFSFAGEFDELQQIKPGVTERKIKKEDIDVEPGLYRALIQATYKGKEDTIETFVIIN
ncbi:S8 family serine peptidase [Salsuginibacillus kocurii]|uniref:S8 family serine peptidase n=1 Tax=Salsuginibacillus kocurii TaxID=427078 RepID=UPI000369C92B|nr:S8 family serine peptidase [Salsuginibacillus kocurii]